MSSAVSNAFFATTQYLQEMSGVESEQIVPSVSNNDSSTELQKNFEALRKQLEEKDKTIQANARSIDRTTKENERLRTEIANKNETILEKETQTAELEIRNTLLERQVMQNRQAQSQPVLAETSRGEAESESVMTSVGQFFRQNRRLFEAGAGATGAVLAACFSPYAVVILLAVGAVIACFDWGTSWFD